MVRTRVRIVRGVKGGGGCTVVMLLRLPLHGHRDSVGRGYCEDIRRWQGSITSWMGTCNDEVLLFDNMFYMQVLIGAD